MFAKDSILSKRLQALKSINKYQIRFVDPEHVDNEDLYGEYDKLKDDLGLNLEELKKCDVIRNKNKSGVVRHCGDVLVFINEIKDMKMDLRSLKIHMVVISSFMPKKSKTLLPIVNLVMSGKDIGMSKGKYMVRFFYCSKKSDVKYLDMKSRKNTEVSLINELITDYENKLPGFNFGDHNDIIFVDNAPVFISFCNSKIEGLIEN